MYGGNRLRARGLNFMFFENFYPFIAGVNVNGLTAQKHPITGLGNDLL